MIIFQVYSVEDNEELEQFVASPVVRIYLYGPVTYGTSSSYMTYCSKLEEIKSMVFFFSFFMI